jgi:hypothetical protein
MRSVLGRVRSALTVYGFHSTFAQWAAERTSYPHEVLLSLAHAVASAVERAYQRSDPFERRRRLMDDWARFCAEPVAPGEVVPLLRVEPSHA